MLEKLRDKAFMSVAELVEIMGMSRAYTYEFIKSDSCPFKVIAIGKRFVIPTNSFFEWYDSFGSKEEQEVEQDGISEDM